MLVGLLVVKKIPEEMQFCKWLNYAKDATNMTTN